jgi:hypothetical protein
MAAVVAGPASCCPPPSRESVAQDARLCLSFSVTRPFLLFFKSAREEEGAEVRRTADKQPKHFWGC